MSAPPEATETCPPLPLTFIGRGADYFRVWSVNLLLTVITLGLYSPWAKVRREKFFHQNTRLAGASFDYHGRPLAIFVGRAIAFALIGLTQLQGLDPSIATIATAMVLALLPLLMQRSVRFRLANASWRGLRFGFDGRARQAYRLFLGHGLVAGLLTLLPLAAIGAGGPPGIAMLVPLALALQFPVALADWRRFVAGHARYGTLPFACDVSRGAFVRVWLGVYGLWIGTGLTGIAVLALVGSLDPTAPGDGRATVGAVAGAAFAYLLAATLWPWVTARTQNLVWNRMRIGQHRLRSTLDVRAFVRLQLVNLALTVITLGLYRPFAIVASVRARVDAMALLPAHDLSDALAGGAAATRAIGDEAVDLLGLDFSL